MLVQQRYYKDSVLVDTSIRGMYGLHAIVYGQNVQQSMGQPGIIANPARGQLNRET